MAELVNDVVTVERDGAIALITIDHPPVNAINAAVLEGLSRALRAAEADDSCRVAIIMGAGPKCFAAGADISEFRVTGGEGVARGLQVTVDIEQCRLPVIAAVNGVAFGGGCEIALACDMRIASDSARFGQPEINLGIIPGWGGTQRLGRIVGYGNATAMLLTGDPISAQRAKEIGLVTDVVSAEELLSTARALALTIASKAPLAIAATKRAIVSSVGLSAHDGLMVEKREFMSIFESDDAKEGAAAFLEKRAPQWTGR